MGIQMLHSGSRDIGNLMGRYFSEEAISRRSGNSKEITYPAVKHGQQPFDDVLVDVFGIAINDTDELWHGDGDTDSGEAALQCGDGAEAAINHH